MIKTILQGMVVGIANIIPGVSGGTMMVAMGLYDRLIHSITHLKSDFKNSMRLLIPIFVGAGLAIVILSRLFEFLLHTYPIPTNLAFCGLKSDFKNSMRLLIPIFVGAGLAIVILSRLFEFLLHTYPIPTNLAFCGLIAGSLPFILKKVKGTKPSNLCHFIPFLIFFGLVGGMAVLKEGSDTASVLSINFIEIIKLFFVGVVAAATMVIPGVSGSMMLMLLGYYETILSYVNMTVDSLIHFDLGALMSCIMILIPFGIGIVIGIFAIAKLIEWIFSKC